MSKPKSHFIKLYAVPAALEGMRDPFGRQYIYKAKAGNAMGSGDDYREAIADLFHKMGAIE
jgi:hypothetical protein